MIDDKFASMTKNILAKVTEFGGSTPEFVLNTHYHGDHTGGNEDVRKRLVKGATIKVFNKVIPVQPEVALPVVTFTRDITFYLNGNVVNIMHVPGAHTDGDSFVHFPDVNVIHTGDVFFNGFYPFIDTENGGNVKGTIAAANKILSLANDKTLIIPGHGPLSNKKELTVYRDMLAVAQERLGNLKATGKTAAQAAATKPLADPDTEWSDGMFTSERWIEVIYDGI